MTTQYANGHHLIRTGWTAVVIDTSADDENVRIMVSHENGQEIVRVGMDRDTGEVDVTDLRPGAGPGPATAGI